MMISKWMQTVAVIMFSALALAACSGGGDAHLDKRIAGVEGRIEGVEGRIEGVDKRIEGVEGRIEGVDKHRGEPDLPEWISLLLSGVAFAKSLGLF